ncbi:DNA methyltransferase [Marinirhabdus gelatinilytica]|uniref:site-specific DNA-methyltransferase (adenine-specific) n=1 Tax=Marinirhabdus gelatinilytica TaxID=1703343 RepID=A0A370QLB8_9FLAO|nr:DNA methyltransferase [Marinirhabdus gelatinilytica]RDK89139.1 type II restriction/modification system DNA methylase subunit YeeA [Marinirhabdus gelatinilytica]
MKENIQKLVEYTARLDGDEKGEAQVFCDRFFQAFGHNGYKEAGATLEFRVKSKKTTNFADLLWGDKVLIEMKKKGAKLKSHRTQIFDYWWKLRPSQPKYSVLCNFEEFIIYDFSLQDEPLDRIGIDELPDRYTSFNFMFPQPETPIFRNNLEEATRKTASLVAAVFNSFLERGEDRIRAQRFILQAIFTMFAEDYNLLPKDIFTQILIDCQNGNGNSYDLINGLFQQMDSKIPARGGRFKDVQYFNGGLFSIPEAIELTRDELDMLRQAASRKWSKVNPAIFGTIFQKSMGTDARHAFGAHFTSELDILKIVQPTIIQPWREKIVKAKTLKEMKSLRKALASYKVLDPACGSGNFLYVAYRELKRIEMELLDKIHIEFPKSASEIGTQSIVSIKQFHGMDYNQFAVELAKVTLMLAKEISIQETQEWINTIQTGLAFQMENTLPLDNMDDNIIFADALFIDWPKANVIIGNPPYQSKNKMVKEYGIEYMNTVWDAYPEISGNADYCVYWFYKAHQNLYNGGYAGLVGTNTVTQNYSREGSLDYIVKNDGQIFNAIASQPWSGDAVVFVSIVNWKKGNFKGKKFLYVENEKKEQVEYVVANINSSLSLEIDVTSAEILNCNKKPKMVFQGQTHGNSGFLISKKKGIEILNANPNFSEVLKPFLIGRELVASVNSQPNRFVIDFTGKDVIESATYKSLFEIVKKKVQPIREKKAIDQQEKNQAALEKNEKAKTNKHHINFYNKWWLLSYGREDMLDAISKSKRYIACSRVSARPIFEFVSSRISPNDALMVFNFQDDYTFGIIQSRIHILWYQEKCSTMKGDPRYTPNTIWDTFPFPQKPTLNQIRKVSNSALTLRLKRNEMMKRHQFTLRDIYRILEEPGNNPLKDLHTALDNAVLEAYGFNRKKDILTQLLELNLKVYSNEQESIEVQAPGLPSFVQNSNEFISEDCISFL